MSSPNGSGWVTPMMLFLAGGLVFYGLSRGPGSCPANTSRSQPPAASVAPPSTQATDTLSAATRKSTPLVHADESNFDEILRQADGLVLVDFYADWCGPCQKLAPVLDRVAQDLNDGRIVKVNVDHNPQLASRYDVKSIPTLLVFDDGQIVKRSMGFHDEGEIRRLLQ